MPARFADREPAIYNMRALNEVHIIPRRFKLIRDKVTYTADGAIWFSRTRVCILETDVIPTRTAGYRRISSIDYI